MEPGDVVKLKCGGPSMVIEFKTVDGAWSCCWIRKGRAYSGKFEEVALVYVEGDK